MRMVANRIDALLADKGYDADAIREDLADAEVEAVIPAKATPSGQPPLRYADGEFDLVINHSDLTHLDEAHQDASLPQRRSRRAAARPDRVAWHAQPRRARQHHAVAAAAALARTQLVENVWQFMRDNWLSNRVFASYADILDHCCRA